MTHEATITFPNGSPVVSDPTLKPQKKPDTLIWTIDPQAGWEFVNTATTLGVAISGNAGQFSNNKLYGNNKKYSWDDANTDTVTYSYTINVQPTGQPHLAKRLDPYIKNGDSK